MTILYKVREINSPYCGVFRGYRMTLVVPNTSGMFGAPAYTKRYIVAESSDLSNYPSVDTQAAFIKANCRGETVTIL